MKDGRTKKKAISQRMEIDDKYRRPEVRICRQLKRNYREKDASKIKTKDASLWPVFPSLKVKTKYPSLLCCSKLL